MSSWLAKTNQQLYQARLLIELTDENDAALELALYQSSVYQLYLAYNSYLHELADSARADQNFKSLQELIDSMPLVTGELKELEHIESDDFSWLAWLLAEFEGSKTLSSLPAAKSALAANLILSSSASAVSIERLNETYQSLQSLINEQRVNRSES